VELFTNWDLQDTLSHLLMMMVAYLLALPIGWNREKEERSAGIRTFPLVAMAACGFVLIASGVPGATPDAPSRILAGLMTGIGFVGGGAILKHGDRATGTATAASLWATGAIGAAVGYGQLDIALVLSVVTFFTLALLAPLHKAAQAKQD
jgi:putative Mg2+ transporter-C (MgtC) family protein